jgi:hypothetical protein
VAVVVAVVVVVVVVLADSEGDYDTTVADHN